MTSKNNGSSSGAGYKAQVKYRDPKTGETLLGRGRMANWLKSKQDASEDIDDYLV
jgi:DNA-binding protein H-NS